MNNEMFYRVNENGDAQIFFNNGEIVTKLQENVFPVGSEFSAWYEQPAGIILTIADAESLGITKE